MRWWVWLIGVMFIAGCAAELDVPGGVEVIERIDLPEPEVNGGRALTSALAQRRSVREFQATSLSLDELSQLLWAAQGITSEKGQRTAPSAGATYPLELYVVTDQGFYHYNPGLHQLESIGSNDLRADLARAALSQESVEKAPAVFVFAGVFARTAQRYGERAERYVKIEIGHAAQNLHLQAVALGLGSVPVGAFHDDEVRAVLNLPPDHEPLYLIPVGYPAE